MSKSSEKKAKKEAYQQAKAERQDWMTKISEARVKQIMEEENELAVRDQEINQIKMETWVRLVEMRTAREAGKEAEFRVLRNEVVVKNLRLVTQVLKKYGYFSPDKFQNGCIGLLKAAETYDLDKEVPFGNYAAFCIETEIRLAFKRVNRAFESKAQGFLDSLDSPATFDNGDTADKHDLVYDPFAEQEFDQIIDEAEIDTLFYDIIIPCIEEYGQRSKDIDMVKWRELEIQYFIELSMEHSQRQRLTFTQMAKELDTVPQNLRIRHKKVMDLVKKRCEEAGYYVLKGKSGSYVAYRAVEDSEHTAVQRMHQKYKARNSKH